MPTLPRKPRKSIRTPKAPTMTRREYVADLTGADLTDVVEMPAAPGCVPILSMGGYLYVVQLPTDDQKAVRATVARLSPAMERLTARVHPGVALYAEPPEGAEHELDCAEHVLAALASSLESGVPTAGTKTEAIDLIRAHDGKFVEATGEAVFQDGSGIAFGQSGHIFGPLFIRYSDGTTMPILAGNVPATVLH